MLPIRQQSHLQSPAVIRCSCASLPIADYCRLLSDIRKCTLRSSSNDFRMLVDPRTHMFGDRSFPAAVPRLWNDLPPQVRRSDPTFPVFRQKVQKLKTYSVRPQHSVTFRLNNALYMYALYAILIANLSSCVLLYGVEAAKRLECVDLELRGPLARRCGELYEFNVEQRTKHEC